MYSLLIADDEALEREGLELMISRMLPDTFRFYHAENGRRAIQMAEEQRPDFIFMDIKMPGIQGLEAVREIAARTPETPVVIITAHDYFAYAKEGLALGVREYLLKPARKEEVLELLKKLIREAEEAKRARNERLELQEKLSRLLPLAENELSLMLMLECVQEIDLTQLAGMLNLDWSKGYAMVLSFSRQTSKEWQTFQLVKKEIYEAVKQWCKPTLSCIVSPILGHQLALFVPFPPGRPAYTQRMMALEWGERLRSQAVERFGVPLSVGIGSVREGWEGLGRSYREAVRVCSEDQEYANVLHYNDLEESSGRMTLPPEEEKKLLDALLRHDKQEAAERFNRWYDRLERQERLFPHLRGEVISLLLYLNRTVRAGNGAELVSALNGFEDSRSLREGALREILTWIDGLREEKERNRTHVLQRALLFVAERYKEDLSMEQCAEYVNLSPYYFSKLFKQRTGENFSDYVTRLRIEEAKKLMGKSQHLSLKEICYEVGYKDPNYFSRVFKKSAGMTPTEYRQQNGI
ncbi:helix-turn-helix domain-containing protein [Paenibacillus sp. M1]|uniref:Helix-turn-helix domain-containing protein n=1 Tax=Paenibacillus haidiansis TaxID=1574488 RepID=A0ABU7VRG2_9BACL